MKTEALIAIASSGYDDGLIQDYYDDPLGPHGDGLAAFIADEIRELTEEDIPSVDQAVVIITALKRAKDQIDGVIKALEGI